MTNIRKDVLGTADKLVNGDRNNQYGDPRQDFQRTAALWTALLGDQLTRPLEDWQVAQFMAALKLSRISWTPAKEDSWVDLAGYAACGAECALWDSRQQAPNGCSEPAEKPGCNVGDTVELADGRVAVVVGVF